ncbi:MAG: hypothetical protein WCW13_03600 [archaeon]|jgi:hypothetical protein
MNFKEWIMKEKITILFSLVLILIVGFIYFGIEGNTPMGTTNTTESTPLQGVTLKLTFNEQNQPKIFALARNNDLAQYKTTQGNSIPENDSMVIGAMEADMMVKEKLFNTTGDKISGLFGISPTIEGVLKETETIVDYFHFVSSEEFYQLTGDENRAYVKIEGSDMSLFVNYNTLAELSTLKLKEGNISDYEEHTIVGTKYYPIILGSTEAEMMREEKEFTNLGDTVEDFGQKFIVVGILEKTNSAFDKAHILPLNATQWGEVKQ